MRSFRRVLYVFVALTIGAEQANSSPEDTIDRQLRQAEAIFVGRVSKVQYTNAVPAEGQSLLATSPYTYVTFEIHQMIKGRARSNELTLRFDGGPVGDGVLMLSSDFPLFGEDEVALLMVASNTEIACPLVDCSWGRYRFVGDTVTTEDGRPLEVDSLGRIALGMPLELEEVMQHEMADFSLQVEAGADPNGEEEPGRASGFSAAATPAMFAEIISLRISEIYTEEELGKLPEATSADPSERLLETPPHQAGYTSRLTRLRHLRWEGSSPVRGSNLHGPWRVCRGSVRRAKHTPNPRWPCRSRGSQGQR